MKISPIKILKSPITWESIIIICLIGVVVYGYTELEKIKVEKTSLLSDKATLEEELTMEREANENLNNKLVEQQTINDTLKEGFIKLGGTVNQLEKLSKMDPELLKKYSKVYFLNENYVPEKLDNINSDFLYDKSKPLLIHAEVKPFFENMMKSASSDGIELRAISAFRSFENQSSLKASYSVTYGIGANKFSADQGYSEHQLGTAVDFTTSKLGANFTDFADTKAYKWLQTNAQNYGFVLSYPENNSYYVFEPWHWRFVGVELAKKLYSDNKYFYDFDQRTIDEYLIKLFDM